MQWFLDILSPQMLEEVPKGELGSVSLSVSEVSSLKPVDPMTVEADAKLTLISKKASFLLQKSCHNRRIMLFLRLKSEKSFSMIIGRTYARMA